MSNIYFISKNMEISIYLIFIQKIRRNKGVDDYFLKIVILNRDKLKFTHFLINLEVDCHISTLPFFKSSWTADTILHESHDEVK